MIASPAAPPTPLRFEIEDWPKELIVRCSGKIIFDTCSIFQNEVRRLLSPDKCVVIDLSKVSSIDSAGLGALVALWTSAKKRALEMDIRWAQAGSSSLSGAEIANDRVARQLRLTRLDKLFGSREEQD